VRHVFTVAAVGLTAAFVAVFFTGRVDNKQLHAVAPRVGMQANELIALVPRVAAQTGATPGTSRRVLYLLACSGLPTASTIETQAREAAAGTVRGLTARQATLSVLSGRSVQGPRGPLSDC
jgi:hypothetical protein